MKLVILFFTSICFSQTYSRKHFDYYNIKNDVENCNQIINDELNEAIVYVQSNNSSKGLEISKSLYEKYSCPEVYETYAVCLFRNGEIIKGIELLEEAIEKFGSKLELIKRKYILLLEMYQSGVRQKNIDGNTVFLSEDNGLKYNENDYKSENLNVALNDINYLISISNDNKEEIFLSGKIYQIKEDFENSNEQFNKLLNDKEYGEIALFNLADNYIKLKMFDEAENKLNALEEMRPRQPEVLEKLSELFDLKQDIEKRKFYNDKSIFYQIVPSFCDLEFNQSNLELVRFFYEDNQYKQKLKKLNELKKANQITLIDACIIILYIHMNHSNGLEDDVAKILTEIGKPTLDKVHKLFQSNISTCTVTTLSEIMAKIKDESSWEIMTEYLPYIAQMPSTLIPPFVPKYVIEFDEKRGLREVLKVVKPFLKEQCSEFVQNMGFSNLYVYFSALEKVNKNELEKACKELEYSDEEIKILKEKIK